MLPTAYTKNVFWITHPNTLELFLDPCEIDKSSPLSAAFCFVFDKKNRLLIVETHKGRLSIPGGGNDQDEAAVETAVREVFEEAAVQISNLIPVGFHKVTCKYPEDQHKGRRPYPIFYEQFFCAKAGSIADFSPNKEIKKRHFFTIEEALKLEPIHYQYNRFMFDVAVQKLGLQ